MKINGIIVPIITPMHPDESVNEKELRNQVERLVEAGIHGIFCFGTNGEGYILSHEEKLNILKIVIDQVDKRVPVYAGTGAISTKDTLKLSLEAERLGADALSIITPSFALASQKELYDHYMEIDAAVNIPIILYNIPARTGNQLLPETVQKLASDSQHIKGVKDSSGDWDNIKAYIDLTRPLDDFHVLSGNDSLILDTLKAGGAGAVAGCANVYPTVLASIYDLFIQGQLDEAQKAQDSITSFRAVFKYGNPNTVVKKAVELLGYPVGNCRKPFDYLPEEGIHELKKVLKENALLGMK